LLQVKNVDGNFAAEKPQNGKKFLVADRACLRLPEVLFNWDALNDLARLAK
jgi:hypothetical protein